MITNGKRLPKKDYIEVIRSLGYLGDTYFAFHYSNVWSQPVKS